MNNKPGYGSTFILLIGFILGIIVFLIDISLPYGNSAWVMYFIPLIFVSWKHRKVKNLYILATFFSFLVLSKFFIYPGSIPSFSIFSRILFIIILFGITFIQVQRGKTDSALEKANQALRESEERFRLSFERAAAGIAHILPSGKWLKINSKYCEIMGYTKEELELITYKELSYPDDLKADLENRGKLLSGELNSFTMEKRYIRKDGSIIWILLTCSLAHEEPAGLKYFVSVIEDISKQKELQKKYEENLQNLEREHIWLNSIMSQMPSGLSIAEAPAGKLLYHNEQAIKIIRHPLRPSEDFSGYMQYGAMHDPETPYRPEEYPIARALNDEIVFGEEMLYRRGDGSFAYFSVNAAPVKDAAGKIIAAISTFDDISRQKQVEEALRINETLMEEFFEVSPGILNLFDDELRYLKTDPLTPTYYGLDSKSIIGKTVWELNPTFAREFLSPIYKRILETGKPELNLIVPDIIPDRNGETSYWSVSYFPVPLYNGGKGLGVIGTDITDINKTQKALKESEMKLLEAQRLAHIGSFTVHYEEGGKVEWSEEMFHIFERDINKGAPTIEEALAMIHPEDLLNIKRVLQRTKEEKIKSEADYRIVTSGMKVKYLHSIFSPKFNSTGALIQLFGTSLDITETMKQQKIIKEALQKLEHSNKELEQFAYVASHDLQEPLRMVSSYVKLLEQRYKGQLDEKAKLYIEYAADGSKRMADLIRDLLAYSRITSQAKEFKKIDLNNIYNEVLRDLQVLIKETGAKITASKLPFVYCDSTQMRQLFQNLIGNAIKFHSKKTPEVNIRAKEIENGLLFSVKDNGIGIDSSYYDRIFQIFQRLHERDKYSGTGIGLAVCKKIVERHGGRIWVESEVGKGTTFYFTLKKDNNLINPQEKDNMEILSA